MRDISLDAAIEVEQLRLELEHRRERLKQNNDVALKLEGSLIELAQENDAMEAALAKREAQLRERASNLDSREDAVRQAVRSSVAEASAVQMATEEVRASLEHRMMILEESLRESDERHAAEVTRIRQALRDAEQRENHCRERLRIITAAEYQWQLRSKSFASHRDKFTDASCAYIEHLKHELKSREELLRELLALAPL